DRSAGNDRRARGGDRPAGARGTGADRWRSVDRRGGGPRGGGNRSGGHGRPGARAPGAFAGQGGNGMTAVVGSFLFFVLFLGVVVLGSSIRVGGEYERLVVFRLGRVVGERGPGLVLLIPIVDRAVKVGLRTVTMDVPPQDIITKDNVSVKVNAVIYFKVVNA